MQHYEQLIASGNPGKRLADWNGMLVYAKDLVTGRTLVDAGSDVKHDPASLTKMMTFYLVMQEIKAHRIRPNEMITIARSESRTDKKQLDGCAWLRAGDRVPVSTLLGAMMTASDNGAALALARRLQQSYRPDMSVVQQMNKTAAYFHMASTHFYNVNGLPVRSGPGNVTSARDMATLIECIHRDFPQAAAEYMGRTSPITYAGHTEEMHHFLVDARSEHHLPSDYHEIAKTGFTNRAHHNISTVITPPHGHPLLVVVMGAGRAAARVAEEVGTRHNKGNHIRDALVVRIAQTFLGGPVHAQEIQRADHGPAPTSPPAPPHPHPVHPPRAGHPPMHDHHYIKAMPAAALQAVAACNHTIRSYERPSPEADARVTVPHSVERLAEREALLAAEERALANPKLRRKKRHQLQHEVERIRAEVTSLQQFERTLNAVEPQTNDRLYTQRNYDEQLARAKEYTDAFVDHWNGRLPPGGKPALKQQFYAIIQGAAGMETGWNPMQVKGAANSRPHTGVFQTEWDYIHGAKEEIARHPEMLGVLHRHADDGQILALSEQLHLAGGLPTTSFAGQGAAFAGMAVASFERHLERGGAPENFNGAIVYQEHMMGVSGALRFREQLMLHPDKKGAPGIERSTYDGNYINVTLPMTGINDLNPQRIPYSRATAQDVQRFMQDKFVHAHNKMVDAQVAPERIAAFDRAFLPEWTNNPRLKAQDIARIRYQKAEGVELRDYAEAQIDTILANPGLSAAAKYAHIRHIACDVLRPMLSLSDVPRDTAAAELKPARTPVNHGHAPHHHAATPHGHPSAPHRRHTHG